MKRVPTIIFIILAVLSGTAVSYADTVDAGYKPQDQHTLSEVKGLVNTELKEIFDFIDDEFFRDEIKKINLATKETTTYKLNQGNQWERALLLYGEPYGDVTDGYHRYLGYTRDFDEVSNVFHPMDTWGVSYLQDLNWVQEPWGKMQIQKQFGIKPNAFSVASYNDKNLYLKSIVAGLKKYEADIYREGAEINDEWNKYVHIMQPPTYYSWGVGKMVNTGSSKKWGDAGAPLYYKTVPLAPFYMLNQKPDAFIKELKTEATEVEAGKKYNGTVTYALSGSYDKALTVKLGLTHNGSSVSDSDGPINGLQIDLQPGGEQTFNFTYTGQDGTDSTLEAKIWPISPTTEDTDWSNNSKKVVVPLKQDVDLEADLLTWSPEIDSGNSFTYTAYIGNSSDQTVTSTVVWRVNGSVKKNEPISIPASGTYSSYTLAIPSGTSTGTKYNLEVEINPSRNQPPKETTLSNNKDTQTVTAYNNVKQSNDMGGSVIID